MKSSTIIVILLAIVLLIALDIGIIFGSFGPHAGLTTTTTLVERSILVSDPSPYFPTGYSSKVVNFSTNPNGDSIRVGTVSFGLVIPSNIETRTTTVQEVSTTITVTADYQCGTSLGQRIFFDAQLSSDTEIRLDYCLILNNAVQIMQRTQNLSMSWSLWQISLNTSPTVALHLAGTGENVILVELAVGGNSNSTTSSKGTIHTSTAYPGSFDTVCRSEGYVSTGVSTTITNSCTAFARSSGTASLWPYELLGNEGTLSLSAIGNFYYFKQNSSIAQSFEFKNLSFMIQESKNLTTATQTSTNVCFPSFASTAYQVIFPDGFKENISSCISPQPNTWELHLSRHTPQAGLLILSDGSLYYLISIQ